MKVHSLLLVLLALAMSAFAQNPAAAPRELRVGPGEAFAKPSDASRVVGDLGLEKRRFPLVTDYPCGFEETVEFRIPPGVTLSPASEVVGKCGK